MPVSPVLLLAFQSSRSSRSRLKCTLKYILLTSKIVEGDELRWARWKLRTPYACQLWSSRCSECPYPGLPWNIRWNTYLHTFPNACDAILWMVLLSSDRCTWLPETSSRDKRTTPLMCIATRITEVCLHEEQHFYPSSALFKSDERGRIITSNVGLSAMAVIFCYYTYCAGLPNFLKLYFLPFLVRPISVS